MSNASNEYQKLIGDLESIRDYCMEMAREQPHGSWKNDIESLQEAMDIISDYEKVVADSNRLIHRYETAAKPMIKSGVCCCPECGRRVQYNHSHCHYCGKRIGWK